MQIDSHTTQGIADLSLRLGQVQANPFDLLKKALSAFRKWRKEILAFFNSASQMGW
jgi:hypothetical protein